MKKDEFWGDFWQDEEWEKREIRRLTSDMYIPKEHLETYKNISYRVALWMNWNGKNLTLDSFGSMLEALSFTTCKAFKQARFRLF